MGKILISLLLFLSFTMLCGCGEGKTPDWFKFAKPKFKKKVKIEPTMRREPEIEYEVEGTSLVSVNGRIITLEDFNGRIEAYNKEIEASKDIPESMKKDYLIKSLEDKKKLLDEMVERELLIVEAIERGLDRDQDIVQAVRALKGQLLFVKLIEVEKNKVNITDAEVESYYNLYKDAFRIPEERKMSMIVVPTEQKAKELLIALLQGGDFAALARANSTDKSAAQGGDIGFIVRQLPFPQPEKKTMFEKFEEVAFSLELNKPSAIFQGPDGFYIIKVREVKPARQMMLSEVYNDIEQGLLIKKQEDGLRTLIGNLRKSANIITHEELLRN